MKNIMFMITMAIEIALTFAVLRLLYHPFKVSMFDAIIIYLMIGVIQYCLLETRNIQRGARLLLLVGGYLALWAALKLVIGETTVWWYAAVLNVAMAVFMFIRIKLVTAARYT